MNDVSPTQESNMSTPNISISDEPTEEEAAAIVAALQFTMFNGGVEPTPAETPRWRFSGRWWSRPVPARRARPVG